MKTQISFKRILIATGASATLLFLSLPLIVGAVPTAVPTGGNVDANFNTVSSSLYYDADDTGYYLDPTSIGTALSIAGGINDPSANPVVLNDNDGTQVLTNDKSSGVIINPLSWGRQEISTTNSLNFSTGGNVVMNLNSGNGSIFFSDGVGSHTVGINQWGLWNSTSNPLKIIDSNGLGISDNGGNVGLLIKSNGDILDNSGSVTIDDDQGLSIIGNGLDNILTVTKRLNGDTKLEIAGDGWIYSRGGIESGSDPSGNRNFRVDNNGNVSNPGISNAGRVRIADSLNVTGTLTTTGNINATGKIKALSIGTYTTRHNYNKASSVTVACNSDEIAVSCEGSSNAGIKTIRHDKYGVFPSFYYTNRCYAYDGDNDTTISAYAFCFNPNG